MGNTISSEEEDEPVEVQQGPSHQEVPIERNVVNDFKNVRTGVFDLYFADLSQRLDEAIRLTKSNELKIDLETGRPNNLQTILLDRLLFKDVGKLNDNNAIVKLMKDAITEMLKKPERTRTQNFLRDCCSNLTLFNNPGSLINNAATKELVEDPNRPKDPIFTPDCYFILYGNEFRLRAIVLKLSEKQIQEFKDVFDPDKKPNPTNDDQGIYWLHKLFREFQESNPKKKDQLKFIERQFGCKFEKLAGLENFIENKTNKGFVFEDYLHIYNQATTPTNQLCQELEIGNKENYRQELNELLSKEKFAYKPIDEQEQQKMDEKQLRDFWISSSHNTYLAGRQIVDKSSVLAYIKVLLTGCRCIELDLHPTKDGQGILITHRKKTPIPIVIPLTASIPFESVLEAINEYAFKTSEYPLILSLEDHCKKDLQVKMAKMFKDYLGDKLLTHELGSHGQHLPILGKLKNKILIKHNALDDTNREEFRAESTKEIFESKLSSTNFEVKYAENDIWHKKLVVLYNDRICIGNIKQMREEMIKMLEGTADRSDEEEHNLNNLKSIRDNEYSDEERLFKAFGNLSIEIPPFVSNTCPETVHLSKPYYHGVLDAKEASARLIAIRDQNEDKNEADGTFIIIRLSYNSNDYMVLVLHQGRPRHVIIRFFEDQEQKAFGLSNDERRFAKLTELVEHYANGGLKIGTTEEQAALRIPCQRPAQTLEEYNPKWFYANMSRAEAHMFLEACAEEGSVLIRTNQAEMENGYIMTVRLHNVIRDYHLKEEDEIFFVNSNAFSSVEEMIEYYQMQPFQDEIRLKPLDRDEMLQQRIDEIIQQPNFIAEMYEAANEYEIPISMRTIASFPAINNVNQTELIQKDQMIHALESNSTRVTISRNGHRYFVEREHFSAWDFDPYEFQEFPLSAGEVEDTIDMNDKTTGDLRDGFMLKHEQTLDDVEFSFDRIRFLALTKKLREDWTLAVKTQIEEANKIEKILMGDLKPAKGDEIAEEMSNLAVYFKALKFRALLKNETTYYNKVCSLSNKQFSLKPHLWKSMNEFNAKKVSRIYPYWMRVLSGNYDPIECWNAGCQMVALNYQTDDVYMLQNHGRFLTSYGYVAKPDYLKLPLTAEETAKRTPTYLIIRVISGQNLSRLFDRVSGICSPLVEFWIDEVKDEYKLTGHGLDFKYKKTSKVCSNSLNPVWTNEYVYFEIRYPELVLIRLQVSDTDLANEKSKNKFVGQAAFPFNCLQTGIRSIPLCNTFNDALELSSLLVEIEIRQVVQKLSDEKPSERQPSKLIGKGRRLGTLSKQPEPMEIDPDQPGPSGTSF